MSLDAIVLTIIYVVGYPIWLGYGINRFCRDLDDGAVIEQIFIAFFWPICVVVYLPYRVFRWVGVRPDVWRQ